MSSLHHPETAEQALRFLVVRHSGRLFRIVCRTGVDATSAEDILQESFLKLWQAPEKFSHSHGSRFVSWFTRLVINRAIDHYRKTVRREILDNDADMPVAFADDSEAHTRQEIFRTAFAQLPPRQQHALNLCFFEDFSNQAAAEIMGISCKALQSLLMRGKAAMRDYVRTHHQEHFAGDLL